MICDVCTTINLIGLIPTSMTMAKPYYDSRDLETNCCDEKSCLFGDAIEIHLNNLQCLLRLRLGSPSCDPRLGFGCMLGGVMKEDKNMVFLSWKDGENVTTILLRI